jgi:hypothetical protein
VGSGGTAQQGCAQLLAERAYDYDLPRAAASDLVVVKQVGGGNVFNHRSSRVAGSGAAHSDGDGMLQQRQAAAVATSRRARATAGERCCATLSLPAARATAVGHGQCSRACRIEETQVGSADWLHMRRRAHS